MLQIWTEPSGYNLGSYSEQVAVSISLPVSSSSGVIYTVISGALPGGLEIVGNVIQGSPFIVANNSDYTFCIRASNSTDFADRTFTLSVYGANVPEFITAAGDLPVGPAKQLYALDGSYVSYQIEVSDLNTVLGDNLKFFIENNDGSLPPGLTLSDSGVISGYITQQLITTPENGNGNFDETYFDDAGYDFGLVPTDGFDHYNYDDIFFDYNAPFAVPKTLNANYQFRVTVTDGVATVQRIFKIFVVGTDEFRADSTSTDGFASDMGFTADASFLRSPVWMTDANLGVHRSNNYLTVPIALYDKSLTLFRVETTNCEVLAISHRVALTDNITGRDTLTITAPKNIPVAGQYLTFDNYIVGELVSAGNFVIGEDYIIQSLGNTDFTQIGASSNTVGVQFTATNVGTQFVGTNVITNVGTASTINATGVVYQIQVVDDIGSGYYRLTLNTPLQIRVPNQTVFYIGTLGELPPGIQFDENSGELYGRVPYQPAITESYTFTITATKIDAVDTEQIVNSKTFTITILGSVTSTITWTSPSNLGTIPANYISTLSVNANSTIPNANVLYSLTSGTLPPGLTLTVDGEFVGTPNQYYNSSTGLLGLTTFDSGNMTFDFNLTTVDRTYTFTITAYDQYQYSALEKTFTLTISTPNTVPYSNITTQPFLNPTQRSQWKEFINNNDIFTPSSIYRTNDPNFGIQSNLQMLVYAGIQTTAAASYVGAMGLGFKKKRFKFGSVETATAIDPNTGNEVYEVVYVKMIDPHDSPYLSIKTASKEPETITADNSTPSGAVLPDYLITIDSTGYEVSNPNTNTYFPNGITNWQARLSQTTASFNNNGNPVAGLTERNYLPLWMRSIPTGQKSQLGYVLCVPLCFCKPGTAATIALNIAHSGFNFNTIDYTVDRFTISAVTGYTSDKYLVFRDDRITV
jgi:hypothetical protein